MLPTPDISHIKSEDYDQVYEPAEDSFLFLDALEKEQDTLKSLLPKICIEIGCGSGIVSTFIAEMLGSDCLYLCSDINVRAATLAAKTALHNKVHVEPVLTDLVESLMSRLQGCVDVLLFNPPYVVTPSEEVGSHGIEASWAGGVDGREVIDRLLPQVHQILSQNGVFYMVIIKENKADDIEEIMASKGFEMSVVMERRSGPERLAVLKFIRNIKTNEVKCGSVLVD